MNLNTIQLKTAELHRLANEADALQRRYAAHLSLFDAACMVGSDQEQVQRRDECHTLLDAILDNSRSVHMTAAELRKLTTGG